MSDVVYVVLTIVLFAVLALVLRGLERLVGTDPDRAPADPGSRS